MNANLKRSTAAALGLLALVTAASGCVAAEAGPEPAGPAPGSVAISRLAQVSIERSVGQESWTLTADRDRVRLTGTSGDGQPIDLTGAPTTEEWRDFVDGLGPATHDLERDPVDCEGGVRMSVDIQDDDFARAADLDTCTDASAGDVQAIDDLLAPLMAGLDYP